MYNLNYRLYATPDSKTRGLYNLSIICKTSRIENWKETPREQRNAEVAMDEMKAGFKMTQTNPEATGIFKGYDNDSPENSRLIMEENLNLTAHGKYGYPIFRRTGFQRHEFGGSWNGSVGTLRNYTQNLISYSKKLGKKLNSRKMVHEIAEIERKCLEENGGKEDFEYMKRLNERVFNFVGQK